MYGCRGNAEHTGTVNSITGARNACKQEALDPTNTEMWHLEGVSPAPHLHFRASRNL